MDELPPGWDDWSETTVYQASENESTVFVLDGINESTTLDGMQEDNFDLSDKLVALFESRDDRVPQVEVPSVEKSTKIKDTIIHKCPKCTKKFKKWENLIVHAKYKCMRGEYKTKKFLCPFCKKYQSSTRMQLAQHIVLNHIDIPDLSEDTLFD